MQPARRAGGARMMLGKRKPVSYSTKKRTTPRTAYLKAPGYYARLHCGEQTAAPLVVVASPPRPLRLTLRDSTEHSQPGGLHRVDYTIQACVPGGVAIGWLWARSPYAHYIFYLIPYIQAHDDGHNSNYLHVDRLYVDPRYRRRGVARQLMQHLVTTYGSTHHLSLHVQPDEEDRDPHPGAASLLAFYMSLGFHCEMMMEADPLLVRPMKPPPPRPEIKAPS